MKGWNHGFAMHRRAFATRVLWLGAACLAGIGATPVAAATAAEVPPAC